MDLPHFLKISFISRLVMITLRQAMPNKPLVLRLTANSFPGTRNNARVSRGNWTKHSLRLRIYAFYQYGHEFHRTAQRTGSLLVRSYLYGHALELFLKAYLLRFSIADSHPRKHGHHVAKLLAESVKNGLGQHLPISPGLESDVLQFSNVYRSKSLEYFLLHHLLAPPKLPNMWRIPRFVNSLDKKLPKIIAFSAS